jgi:hypothetical protein
LHQPKNNSQLNDIQLYKYLRENLEQEKVPHEIYFFKELPKGISKIQVEQLKKIILENRKKPSESGEATLEIIIQTAALTFKIDSNDYELSSSSTLSGWDSLNNLILLEDLLKFIFQRQRSWR